MNAMSENTRDDRFALGGVVLKVFVEPAVGVNRAGDEIPCGHGEDKHGAQIPRHDGKAGKRQNLAQILRAADKAKAAAIGDFVARFVRAWVGGPQVTQDTIRVDVEHKADNVDSKADAESGIGKPVVGVLGAQLSQIRSVEVAVQKQCDPARDDHAERKACLRTRLQIL